MHPAFAMSTSHLLLLGLAVRLVLLLFGLWQDANLQVKYTDIDYEVYTDAARFILQGGSPYDRSTYRYSPLLAFLMVPNVVMQKAFGKLLFCACDLLAAWLFRALLSIKNVSDARQALSVALWLFNPLTITISTRGSCEAVVTCMLLGLLLLLHQGRYRGAGCLYGLAVHYRLYPVIYSWPLLLHLGTVSSSSSLTIFSGCGTTDNQPRRSARHVPVGGAGNTPTAAGQAAPALLHQQPACQTPPLHRLASICSRRGVVFGLSAATTFLGLGCGFYCLYGWPFLHETYLYHVSRVDPRHNFSPFFLPAYLASATSDPGATPVSRSLTLSQAVLQLALGWRFAGDLPYCLLLQTMVLVTFNKVCTAQYFVWYLTFLPLALPQLLDAPNKGRLMCSLLAWVAGMGHWLYWAYELEFQGRSVFVEVWAASLVFFATQVWVVAELVRAKSREVAVRNAEGKAKPE